jgi:REP-associated tyrosine transposase
MSEPSWLDFDPSYRSLGNAPGQRAETYRKWLFQTIPEGEWKLIREAAQRGLLTANRKYEIKISKKSGRRIELGGQRRPKKNRR